MPTPTSTSALPPKPDLPIAIRKGVRSTRNLSSHYVALSYHRFSSLHYACLSSLSSMSILTSPGEALSHPERRYFRIVVHGNWSLFLQVNWWLVVDGFIL